MINIDIDEFKLFFVQQSGAAGVDDIALQRRVLGAGNQCASAYKELLEQVNLVFAFGIFGIFHWYLLSVYHYFHVVVHATSGE